MQFPHVSYLVVLPGRRVWADLLEVVVDLVNDEVRRDDRLAEDVIPFVLDVLDHLAHQEILSAQ